MTDNATQLPLDHCPSCNSPLDAATFIESPEKVEPEVGDVSICIMCGAALRFDDGLRLQLMSTAEVHEVVQQVPKFGAALQLAKNMAAERTALDMVRGMRPKLR